MVSTKRLNRSLNYKNRPMAMRHKDTAVLHSIKDFKKEDYTIEDKLLSQENESSNTKVMSIKTKRKMNRIKEKKSHSLPAKHPEAEKRTIFVGNVQATVSKKRLQQFFSTFGKIETVRLRGIATESMNMSKKEAITQQKLHPNRKTIIAYIRFIDESSKEKAIQANGVEFDGLHLRVDSAIPKLNKEKNSVFVGNLPFEVEDEDLWKLFGDCGEIDSIRIVRSSITGAGKGFGFVNFKSKDSIEMAFQLNGRQIKNRSIRIKRMAKKGKEIKRLVQRKKSASSSLVSSQQKNKMNLSFMKQDKPRYKIDIKKGKKKEKPNLNVAFTGAKTAEDGKLIKKKKKPRTSKADKQKMALARILVAKASGS